LLKTIPGMRSGEEIKEKGSGDELKYDIFDI
jgi:hypothetical protein